MKRPLVWLGCALVATATSASTVAGVSGVRPPQVTALADVRIVSSLPATKVAAGGSFWGTFKVQNGGPDKARGIHVFLTLPPGLSKPYVESFGSTCSGLDCIVKDLDPGGEGTVYFTATLPNTVGKFVVTASVSTTTDDPDPSNNSADAVFDA